MSECVFCRIIRGDIKGSIVKETQHILVVNDIAPKAPVHYLILPKKHIESMATIGCDDKEICWAMWEVTQALSRNLSGAAFNIVANNGAGAGQSVFHLHWHFLAGKNLYSSGFSL